MNREQIAALIAEAQALCDAATPGPWSETHNGKFGVAVWGLNRHCLFRVQHPVSDSIVSAESPVPQWQHDVTFIRRARTLIPELIAALTPTPPEGQR